MLPSLEDEMLSNHERFKDIASGFQSIALCIALGCGGLWAVYTFLSTLASETAKAKYDKALRDLREQRVVNISLNPSNRLAKIFFPVSLIPDRRLDLLKFFFRVFLIPEDCSC